MPARIAAPHRPRAVRVFALALIATAITFVPGAARATAVEIHGLLDVVATERGEAYELNVLTRGDAPFDAFGVRMFVNAEANPKLHVFTQLVLRDASGLYVDGAYLMYTPSAAHDAHILAGKVPWAIGTYAPRTYSNKNPLIGTPLIYQYHTTLLWYAVPLSADALIAAAGSGQQVPGSIGYGGGRGMPIVDDSYWDVGVSLIGAERPFEYALGVTNGAPGWGSTSEEENGGKTVLGRIGVTPIPALRLGVSGAIGPYLDDVVKSSLPPGKAVDDYQQKLVMADLDVEVGHAELRAEAVHNTWGSPFTGDLGVRGGYVELKVTLPMGAFVAGRWDALRFGRIADSASRLHTWDTNVSRIESGVGYRFDREVVAKFVYQQTRVEPEGAPAIHPGLFAAQVSVAF